MDPSSYTEPNQAKLEIEYTMPYEATRYASYCLGLQLTQRPKHKLRVLCPSLTRCLNTDHHAGHVGHAPQTPDPRPQTRDIPYRLQ